MARLISMRADQPRRFYFLSQASPMPSWSLSRWSALATSGQLSRVMPFWSSAAVLTSPPQALMKETTAIKKARMFFSVQPQAGGRRKSPHPLLGTLYHLGKSVWGRLCVTCFFCTDPYRRHLMVHIQICAILSCKRA